MYLVTDGYGHKIVYEDSPEKAVEACRAEFESDEFTLLTVYEVHERGGFEIPPRAPRPDTPPQLVIVEKTRLSEVEKFFSQDRT